jgi:hypothetical protein
MMPGDGLFTAAGPGRSQQLVKLGDLRKHRLAVRPVVIRLRIEPRG